MNLLICHQIVEEMMSGIDPSERPGVVALESLAGDVSEVALVDVEGDEIVDGIRSYHELHLACHEWLHDGDEGE